jgi:ABC-type antimicrobial peptide transport system permease subunit
MVSTSPATFFTALGVRPHTVTRRTHEIGIRIALGAAASDLTRMVFRGALGQVCAGLAIGVPLALLSRGVAGRVVADLPADSVWPLVVATAAMLAIALAAAYVPARRAARVDPIEALRL